MKLQIACIPGDGIGPEIVAQANKVLDQVAKKFGHEIERKEILMGGASIDVHGVPLTDEAIATAKAADAVLMGSIGGDTNTSPWYKLPPEKRPEAGLLKIRKALNLFANLRPAYLYPQLAGACPLKEEISQAGFDMLIMRELTGGLYFGERHTTTENGVRKAVDTLTYTEEEIRRIAIKAFDVARKRKGKVTSVDKVTGSIGMLSSASLNDTKFGLYEPSHGSAPDIAGKDLANPIATVLSAAMMLRYTFDLDKEAEAVEEAVRKVLAEGYRTGDIMSEGCTLVGCSKMGDLLAERI